MRVYKGFSDYGIVVMGDTSGRCSSILFSMFRNSRNGLYRNIRL